jgi:poly(A) polymerase
MQDDYSCPKAFLALLSSLPKYLTARIRDIWMMQSKLEKMHPKKVQFLLGHPRFRMGYDFLVLRSKSINPELKEAAAAYSV